MMRDGMLQGIRKYDLNPPKSWSKDVQDMFDGCPSSSTSVPVTLRTDDVPDLYISVYRVYSILSMQINDENTIMEYYG